MFHTLWVMSLWISLWRLAAYAGMTQNVWLLVTDMFLAYLMCIKWYPIWTDKNNGDNR